MHKKKAFTMIEVAVATVVLAAAMLTLAQWVDFATDRQLAERTRRTASDQLQNVLERLDAVPVQKRVALDFDRAVFETLLGRALPGGTIEFRCKPLDTVPAGPVKSYVFTAAVSWDTGAARPRSRLAMPRLLTLAEEGGGPDE